MSLSRKISTDVLASALFKITLKARGLLFIPLFTLWLGVDKYGAYVQVIGITIVIANICTLAIDTGIVRLVNEYDDLPELISTVLVVTISISIIGGALMSIGSPLLSKYTLGTPIYRDVFLVAGLYIPFEVLYRISNSYYHATRRVKLYSGIEAVDTWLAVGTVAIVITALNGSLIEVFYTLVAVKALVAFGITGSILWQHNLVTPTKTCIYEVLQFSIPALGSHMTKHVLDKTDRVLLGFFIGASAVGTYSVAYSISYFLLLYVTPLNNSFYTEFSKLWEENNRRAIRNYTVRGIRYFSTLALPSIVGFYLIGSQIVNIISTESVAMDIRIPLALISLSMFLRGIMEVYQKLFYATGDSRTPVYIQISIIIINIVINVLLIPILGVVGAALATVISFTFGGMLMGGLFQQRLNTAPEFSIINRILISSILMGLIAHLIFDYWLFILFISPLLYFVILTRLGGLPQSDIQLIRGLIRGIR